MSHCKRVVISGILAGFSAVVCFGAERKDSAAALLCAAWEGDLETVNRLLDAGIEVDATDKRGRTPLYYAAMAGHVEIVQALIAADAEVNARDNSDFVPLHGAAACGQLKAVELLLDEH